MELRLINCQRFILVNDAIYLNKKMSYYFDKLYSFIKIFQKIVYMYLGIFFRLYDFNLNLKLDFNKRFTVEYIIQSINYVNFLKHSEIMFVVY